ncbi:hypothetical protein RvY_00345 [Ramazzottius varieornatus]|uniref:Kazal-like domain-containing protein n=1 Tax=Ramazzottius varieornatus TaxID=947166 RepID=A0A1D1UMD9_RAMVA|nr:hypothetical protein RvY_00345 [Ramazzottius varieornatus]
MISVAIVGLAFLVSAFADNVPPNCDCSAMPNKRLTCGNDGHNYTDTCAYVNARVSNPNLGWRPCFQPGDQEAAAQWLKTMHAGMDPAAAEAMGKKERQACLTNGQSMVGTMRVIIEQVLGMADVSIACMKPCPCSSNVCPGSKA